jgi:protein O-GlcNAc transferase
MDNEQTGKPPLNSNNSNAENGLYQAAIEAYRLGNSLESQRLCGEIQEGDSEFPNSLHLLSAISLEHGEIEKALEQCLLASELSPANVAILNGLALAQHAAEKLVDAIATLNKAIALPHSGAEHYANLSMVLSDLGRLDEALAAADKALAIDENFVAALNNKGLVYQKLGRAVQAIDCFDNALSIQPKSPVFLYNKLTCANYSPNLERGEISRLTELYWEAKGTQSTSDANGNGRGESNRPLNIGFISADIRLHAVGILFKPYFENRDRASFSVSLYYNHPTDDEFAQSFKRGCERWRDVFGVSDESVARQIAADEIDILIDLSGHTDGNRLGVMKLKPAPVQATWLGYVATTGVPEIDFIICDKYVLPEDDEDLYVEKPVRLPGSYLSFSPPFNDLKLTEPPIAVSDHVVFGSLSNVIKMNVEVYSAWAEILRQVPEARLLLKSPQLSNNSVRRSVLQQCAECGIANDRLTLVGNTTRREHLETYARVDIALDTFPYGGGVTTAEAIWMGVPVITLAGDGWQARAGQSILESIGLPHLITHSIPAYIERAVELASNHDDIISMRKSLRIILQASPFCDGKQIARDVESAFTEMWLKASSAQN